MSDSSRSPAEAWASSMGLTTVRFLDSGIVQMGCADYNRLYGRLQRHADSRDINAAWAVERWHAEVARMPMDNPVRLPLDRTWRQVIRHFGGDDVALCGPSHYTLVQQGGRDDG